MSHTFAVTSEQLIAFRDAVGTAIQRKYPRVDYLNTTVPREIEEQSLVHLGIEWWLDGPRPKRNEGREGI